MDSMSTIPKNSQNPHCTNENLKFLLNNAINRLNDLNIANGKTYYDRIISHINSNKTPTISQNIDLSAIVNNASKENIERLIGGISEQILPFKSHIRPNATILEILCKSYGNIEAFYYLSFGFPKVIQQQSNGGGKSKRNIKPKSDKRRTRRK